MKAKKLRLSPNTSLKAIEAVARRASAISAVERMRRRSVLVASATPEAAPQRKPNPAIFTKGALRSIRAAIGRTHFVGLTPALEDAGKHSSAVAVVNFYDEAEYFAYVQAMSKRAVDNRVSTRKPKPVYSYYFYASVENPDRLDSIAVYGKNVAKDAAAIERAGYLFGIPVYSAKVEMGFRPFLNVKLAA